MTTLLFANDAATTLQSGISAGATTATLAAGTGALFPNPATGQAYFMTLLDASTQQVKEIVLVLSRSGDTVSMVRGQQNTLARVWNAGDLAVQLNTAGDMDGLIQPDQLQQSTYTVAAGSGANSITASLDSGLAALPAVMQFTVMAAAANTGNVTLTLTLGLTLQSAYPVLKYNGSQLNAGDIPGAGFPIEVTWVSALTCYVMTNPASGTAGSIAGGLANELLVQTAPGTTGFVAAPTVAGQVLAFVGGVLTWIVSAVTSFNGRGGAVVPQSGDYTAAQVGAVPTSAFTGANIHLAQPMFMVLPNGAIMQGGTLNVTPNNPTSVGFPKIFPNACISVVATCNNQTTAIGVESITTSGFLVKVNTSLVYWMAIGY